MIPNYHYFLVLAEELKISSAAERLYISHQCLSKYIKGIEETYDTVFFERKPHFSLSPAGKVMLESLRDVELVENNLQSKLNDIKESRCGTIRFGITEGRYSILVPKLLKEFHQLYPKVELMIHRAQSPDMQKMVVNNTLDLFLSGTNNLVTPNLKYETIINENMYIVISDNLLKRYFSNQYPGCKEIFARGIDLHQFKDVPFVLSERNFNSRILLEQYLSQLQLSLNCINEMTQPDIHILLCAEDYAASFCLSMYLTLINQLNQSPLTQSQLNVFPIKGFTAVNPLALVYHKNKYFPSYINHFKEVVARLCGPYSTIEKK